MNLKSLQDKAKQLIDRRGGTESLKADAEELKNIAKGPGSVTDKAKLAAEALKDPGAKGPDTPAAGADTRAAGADTRAAGADTPAAGADTPAAGADAPTTSEPGRPPGV